MPPSLSGIDLGGYRTFRATPRLGGLTCGDLPRLGVDVETFLDNCHDVGVALVHRAIKAYSLPMDSKDSIARTLTAHTHHSPKLFHFYPAWLLRFPPPMRR